MMRKGLVLQVVIAVVAGAGLLATLHWLADSDSPAAVTRSEALPPVLQVAHQDGLADGAAGMARPPTANSVRMTHTPPNIQDLSAMPLPDITRIFRLDELPEQGGRLVLNHLTRTIVEDLVLTLPKTEIARNRSRLEQAVALSHGSQAAAEFSRILTGFVNYKEAIAAIDEERNARDFVPGNATDDNGLRQRLQREAFGPEQAAQLFRVERETLDVLNRQATRLHGSNADLSPEQMASMQAEYQDILAKEGGQ